MFVALSQGTGVTEYYSGRNQRSVLRTYKQLKGDLVYQVLN